MSGEKIKIAGAGFSGLSLAYFFVKKGYSVELYESSSRVGGVIRTEFKKKMLVEHAANGFISTEKIEELFKDIGCELLRANTKAKNKFIFRKKLRRWPLTFFETVALMKTIFIRWVQGTLKPRPTETLENWGVRCLGTSATNYLLEPVIFGVFGSQVKHLNAAITLKSLFFKKKKGQYKGLVFAPRGMQEVIDKLKIYLEKNGVKFFMNKSPDFADDVTKMDYHAVNFSALNKIFDLNISGVSLLRVTINFKMVDVIDGFGVLFPEGENFHSLGVLANTQIFSENRGDYNETWILGGTKNPEYLELSDNEIIELIKEDRKKISSKAFEIQDFAVVRWQKVLPLYNEYLRTVLDPNFHASKSEKTLFDLHKISGNFAGVIGLSGILERNFDLVEKHREFSAQRDLILLSNVGSPISTNPKSVRKYLQEFLTDPLVIPLPWPIRYFVFYWIVPWIRSPKSAEKYKKIWLPEGSPLVVNTKVLAKKISQLRGNKNNTQVNAYMRYQQGNWSFDLKYKNIFLLPLYPQYAESTTLSAIKKLKVDLIKSNIRVLSIYTLKPFYRHPNFINSWVLQIKKYSLNDYQALVFSYHGLPDTPASQMYKAQCLETSELIFENLKNQSEKLFENMLFYSCFQSRLGPKKWISPYTDELLRELPRKGIKKILILCPSFVTDCLETLEEINMENRSLFLNSGGEKFDYVSCPNSEDHWVKGLSEMIDNLENFDRHLSH